VKQRVPHWYPLDHCLAYLCACHCSAAMPRWKRQQRAQRRDKRHTLDHGNRTIDTSWNAWKERRALVQYLLQYKQGAIDVYYHGTSRHAMDTEDSASVTIGFVSLPVLTTDVLRQPYLTFPVSLTNKQRKAVHETCIEGE
jgi:hypothetical protein